MKRREFIALLGGAAAWPLAAHAQQGERMRRIGVLLPYTKDDPEDQRRVAALQEGLARLGWTDGRNLRMDFRWYAGDAARARSMAAELADLRPDLMIAGGTQALAGLREQAPTIPIVFVAVSDPIGQGFVQSLARPGGNITGFTLFEFSVGGKLVQTLREAAPQLSRLSVIFNPETAPYTPQFLHSVETAAVSIAAQSVAAPVRSVDELKDVITAVARDPNGGLIVPPDAFTLVHREVIISLAAQYRLPAIYSFRFCALDGGLMSYGVDIVDLYRRSAAYMDRIFKGEKPGELPIQQPTKFEFVVNLKTAKALGLTVPDTLLATADEVIE